MSVDIEKALTILLNKRYLKIILMSVGITILLRNFLYLFVFEDVSNIFTEQKQEALYLVFGVEVPRLIMTVIWPVIFAILNKVTDLKISPKFFYSVIGVHLLTCLATVFIMASMGCHDSCNNREYNIAIYGGSLLTVFSTFLSYWIYSTKSLFIDNENSDNNLQEIKNTIPVIIVTISIIFLYVVYEIRYLL